MVYDFNSGIFPASAGTKTFPRFSGSTPGSSNDPNRVHNYLFNSLCNYNFKRLSPNPGILW